MNRKVAHRSGTSNLLLGVSGKDSGGVELNGSSSSPKSSNSHRSAVSLPVLSDTVEDEESSVPDSDSNIVVLSLAETAPATSSTLGGCGGVVGRKNALQVFSLLNDRKDYLHKSIGSYSSSASLDSGFGGDSSKRPSLENDNDKFDTVSEVQHASDMNQYQSSSCLLEKQILSNEVENNDSSDCAVPLLHPPQTKVTISKEAFEDMLKATIRMFDESNLDGASHSKLDGDFRRISHRRGSYSPAMGTEKKSKPSRKLSSAAVLCKSSISQCDEESRNFNFRKPSSYRSHRISTEKGPYSTVLVKTSTMTRKLQDRRRFSEVLEVYKPAEIPFTEIVVPSLGQLSEYARSFSKDHTIDNVIEGTCTMENSSVEVSESPNIPSSSTPINEHHNGRPGSPSISFLGLCQTSSSKTEKPRTLSFQLDEDETNKLNFKKTSSADSVQILRHASIDCATSPPMIQKCGFDGPFLPSEFNKNSHPCYQKFCPFLPKCLGRVVDQNMPQFVQFTDWTCLYPYLISKNLLNDHMREYIINTQVSNQDKGNKFYGNYLVKMGEEGYLRLFECLREEKKHLGHQELLKILEVHFETSDNKKK